MDFLTYTTNSFYCVLRYWTRKLTQSSIIILELPSFGEFKKDVQDNNSESIPKDSNPDNRYYSVLTLMSTSYKQPRINDLVGAARNGSGGTWPFARCPRLWAPLTNCSLAWFTRGVDIWCRCTWQVSRMRSFSPINHADSPRYQRWTCTALITRCSICVHWLPWAPTTQQASFSTLAK